MKNIIPGSIALTVFLFYFLTIAFVQGARLKLESKRNFDPQENVSILRLVAIAKQPQYPHIPVNQKGKEEPDKLSNSKIKQGLEAILWQMRNKKKISRKKYRLSWKKDVSRLGEKAGVSLVQILNTELTKTAKTETKTFFNILRILDFLPSEKTSRKPLCKLAYHKNKKLAKFAIQQWSEVAAKEDAGVLMQFISGNNSGLAKAAQKTLLSLWRREKELNLLPYLLDAITSEKISSRASIRICRLISRVGGSKAIPELQNLYERSAIVAVRENTIRLLGPFAEKDTVRETLLKALEDENAGVKKTAIQALGKAREPAAIGLLIALLKKPESITDKSGKNIKKEPDPAAVALKQITGLNYGQNRNAWQKWWQQHQKKMQNLFTKELRSSKEQDNLKAIRTLGSSLVGREEIALGLLPFLKHRNSAIVAQTCQSLGELGIKKHREYLENLLNNPDKNIQQASKKAWLKLGGKLEK